MYSVREHPGLPPVVDLFQDPRQAGLYSAFVWLNIFPGISVSCYKINISFPVLLLRGFIPGITLSWSNPKLITADLH